MIEYLAEYLEKPDPDVPSSVLDGTCSFDTFRYILQIQAIGEPLMHRLNQGIKTPKLGYSPVAVDQLRKEKKELQKCMEEVHGLLKEMLEEGDPCTATVLSRNDALAQKAVDLIEEIL